MAEQQHTASRHESEHKSNTGLLRCLLAEVVGTFLLTFVSCGGEMIAAWSHQQVTLEMRSLAPGLLVMALIYAIGPVSGAHINPVITLAFALRRVFPWRRAPLYLVAQFIGALLAPWVLLHLLGDIKHLGTSDPHVSDLQAFGMETLLTTLLAFVILSTASWHRVVGPNAAIAVGATIAVCGLFSKPVSDASMNPARSLAPALVSGHLGHIWVYLAGPLLGVLVAVTAIYLIQGAPKREEAEAASGKKQ